MPISFLALGGCVFFGGGGAAAEVPILFLWAREFSD